MSKPGRAGRGRRGGGGRNSGCLPDGSTALELAPHGVRVNAVAPGPTESEALAASGLPATAIDEIKAAEATRIPLGRRGEPDEVALWILRLADAHTAWLTGQVLTVDGGFELV